MAEEIKKCYVCGSVEDARNVSYERTVRYKGETVVYTHVGTYCDACDLPYDAVPYQTEPNRQACHEAYLQLLEE